MSDMYKIKCMYTDEEINCDNCGPRWCEIKVQGPVQQNGSHFSCSLCKHFTSNIDNLCLVNPDTVKRRITYDEVLNIFCCDLTIVCDTFERNYDNLNGWII